MLRLEAESWMADRLARVELGSRLGRAELEGPPAGWFERTRREGQRRAARLRMKL